jgi:parallel beta-helix repeat protein
MVGGVDLVHSDYNTFSRNTIHFISLYKSSYNILEENNLPQGISIRNKSNYNEITENGIIDFNELTEKTVMSSGSVTIERSEGNVVSSNTIVNSGGIFITTSSNNVFRNNSVSATGIGFEVSGDPQPSLSSFINDIDESNTINGKKIYYLIDKSDLSINPSTYPNIGYLALVNCKRMIVENNHLNTQGMLLAWTTNSQITKNDVSNNQGNGIILNYASNNQITQNNINSNSEAGMRLSYSSHNTVSGNYITRNQVGLSLLLFASNNTINENNIADQDIGISLRTSSNNLIYHNNFVNNTKQVYDVGWQGIGQPFPGVPLPSENIWDNNFPAGGNYWSDYSNQYPEAKELGTAGIWDTPYVVDENNQDRYPLKEPVAISEFPTASDGNKTGNTEPCPTLLAAAVIVSIVAVVTLAALFHIKRHKH